MSFWVENEALDPIQGAWRPFLFQILEVAVGICCCCLPTLPPVFRRWGDQWNTASLVSKVFKKLSRSTSEAPSDAEMWADNPHEQTKRSQPFHSARGPGLVVRTCLGLGQIVFKFRHNMATSCKMNLQPWHRRSGALSLCTSAKICV